MGNTQTQMANQMRSLASLAGSGGKQSTMAEQLVIGQATQKMDQGIETWLNQYGNTRISINSVASDGYNLDGSSFDFLLPLSNTKTALTFIQFDTHYQDDDRLVGNAGIGQRFFMNSGWMLGINAFYDQDLTGTTSRAGIGAEAWKDYLKLSANGYFAISDWHNSEQMDDYDEKAANGFDVQVDGYFPAYPQLGGTLKYEQYYGQNVALFDTDHLQNNPSAVTAGFNYTPVPLVTFGANYKIGQGGENETEVRIDFNYALGVPWSEQVSSDAVAIRRSLAGSRMDFVNRNNDIVMQYRKQDVIRLSLPDLLTGEASASVPLTATITSRYGVDHINWDSSSSVLTAGGQISRIDATHYTLVLPATAGDYRLRGTAYDKKGNASKAAETEVKVQQSGSTSAVVSMTASPANSLAADGHSASILTATVKDENGKPVSTPVTWAISQGHGVLSDQQTTTVSGSGQATAKLTDGTAESTNVTVTIPTGTIKSVTTTVTFVASSFSVDLTASPTTLPADNTTATTLTATVKDSAGNPIENASVAFDSGGKGTLSHSQATSGKDGVATVTLKDGTAESVDVAAGATVNGTTSSTSTTVKFTSTGTGTIVLSTPAAAYWTDYAIGGSNQQSLTATVKDKDGNPINSGNVVFTASSGLTANADNGGAVNAQGIAKVYVGATTPNPTAYTLKACIDNECSAPVILPFYDPPKVVFSHLVADSSLTSLPDARLQYGQLTLSASGGNQSFTWQSSDSTAVPLDSLSGITNIATLNDNKPTDITVSTLGRTSPAYSVGKGSKMLYIDINKYVTYPEAENDLSSSSDIRDIVNAWGGGLQLAKYTAYAPYPKSVFVWTNDTVWDGNTTTSSNGASAYNVDVDILSKSVAVYENGIYLPNAWHAHIN